MLEVGFLEGMLAEWEAFKICFVCIFVHKSSKISPQEHVLQQHSCLSVHGKLRQKEYGAVEASWLKSSERYLLQGKETTWCLHSPRAAAGSAELSA